MKTIERSMECYLCEYCGKEYEYERHCQICEEDCRRKQKQVECNHKHIVAEISDFQGLFVYEVCRDCGKYLIDYDLSDPECELNLTVEDEENLSKLIFNVVDTYIKNKKKDD